MVDMENCAPLRLIKGGLTTFERGEMFGPIR